MTEFPLDGSKRTPEVVGNRGGLSLSRERQARIRETWSAHGVAGYNEIPESFSFAFKADEGVVCVRDHLGIEPLYFAIKHGRLGVSNRYKRLAKWLVKTSTNVDYLCAHLLDPPFYHPELTFSNEILRVPPGHVAIFDRSGQRRLSRYWKPELVRINPRISFEEAVETVREICVESVRNCVSGHTKVGVHASGGLDCSAVAAIAKQVAPDLAINLFSWLPDTPGQERDRVEMMAEQIKAEVSYLPQTPQSRAEYLLLNPLRTVFESTLPQEFLVQRELQSRGYRLLLSGWGGDESFTTNSAGFLSGLIGSGQLQRFAAEILHHLSLIHI